MLLRIVGTVFYLLLGCLILAFIFSNRLPVSVDFFPFGQSGEMPLYILLSILFVAGLVLGLLHSGSVWLSMRRKLKRSERAIAQLEKEVAAKSAVAP
jgi:uncharacterized membrane protein YciS (DUF1049 family)